MSKKIVRIETKRWGEVRTKKEQRKGALICRQTKNFVRIYKEIGIEKKKTDVKRQRSRVQDI